MPSKISRYIYWDSNIFLSYLNKIPDRYEKIDALWDEVSQNKKDRIITSSLTIAEVAYVTEQNGTRVLDAETLARVDSMLQDQTVLLISASDIIMYRARDVIRDVASRGWKIAGADAVHMATALWTHENFNPVSVLYSYDPALKRLNGLFSFPILEPEPLQPKLIV